MSIEQHLTELKVALEENTAAIKALLANGGGQVSKSTTEATTTKGKAGKGKAETETKKGPIHTQAEATAAIVKVKDTFGLPEAKKIVEELGFAKMSDITEDKFDEAFDLAETRYAELEAEKSDEGGL